MIRWWCMIQVFYIGNSVQVCGCKSSLHVKIFSNAFISIYTLSISIDTSSNIIKDNACFNSFTCKNKNVLLTIYDSFLFHCFSGFFLFCFKFLTLSSILNSCLTSFSFIWLSLFDFRLGIFTLCCILRNEGLIQVYIVNIYNSFSFQF